MFKALQEGWSPPSEVSLEDYNAIRRDKLSYADALVGFVGFGCSYGGKFFGGYARGGKRTSGVPRNYADESARRLEKMRPGLCGAHTIFILENYWELFIPNKSLIYCDPPYSNTTKYTGTRDFDTNQFWLWAEQQAKEGHKVLVSEYEAPEHWTCIWSKELTTTMDKNPANKKRQEKLFTL
jgi:DNA adenine methylase